MLHMYAVPCNVCFSFLLLSAIVLQECAVLDLVATQVEEQGKGHCSAMLGALEGWLGPQLGVSSLIAVCPADVSATGAAACCLLPADLQCADQGLFAALRMQGRQKAGMCNSS
jgi:hypothetical protein